MTDNEQFNNGGRTHIDPKPHTNEKWTFWLATTGFLTCVGSAMPVGYAIGVLNSPENIVKAFCNESLQHNYDIHITTTSLTVLYSTIVSIFIIGGMIGSLIGASLSEKLGRKNSMLLANVIELVAGLMFVLCKVLDHVELLLLGRFLIGFAGGIVFAVLPMYLTELSPLKLRGIMGALCPLGVTTGVLVAQLCALPLGTVDSWHYLLALYLVLTIPTTLMNVYFPESPKYLFVIKNNPQLARKELSRVRNVAENQLSYEIKEYEEAKQQSSDTNESWSLVQVVRCPELLLPLLITCALQGGQQLSGINAVFYYSGSIFQNAGLSESASKLASIGAAGVNVIVTMVGVPFMSRVGRRPLLLTSTTFATTFLVTLCFSFNYINSTSWMPLVCVFSCLSYVFFFAVGLGPIPYFIASELFDVGPKPAAMALGSMANWTGNFCVGMAFPLVQQAIGAYSFLIFAAICFSLLTFCFIYLPETLERDISEISRLCSRGLKSSPRLRSEIAVDDVERELNC